MGEILGKLFSKPSLFPGGETWTAVCQNCTGIGAANNTECDFVIEQLGCHEYSESFNFYGFVQCVFHLVAYGYILFVASNLISDGSELLLFIKSIQGIVGSVVLPILGAIPDGAIVLFSGLGPNAQKEVAVGVGALAGSTVMLLTIPWGLSIFAGRVDLIDGTPMYRPPKTANGKGKKLTSKFSLFESGIETKPIIKVNALLMLVTCVSYVIIQGAAFSSATGGKEDDSTEEDRKAAEWEKWFAFSGFIISTVLFFGYLYYQIRSSNSEDRMDQLDAMQKSMISAKKANLSSAFYWELREAMKRVGEQESLIHTENPRLRKFLLAFFSRYDQDNSGTIDVTELSLLLADMGEKVNPTMLYRMREEMDLNKDGKIDFEEFASFMPNYILNGYGSMPVQRTVSQMDNEADEDDSEEEDVPEELKHEDPEKQMRNIKVSALWQMGLGTLLVLLFADPMCDVLNDVGFRTNIPPFYISFIVAPLASNASELIASYNYALKKTKKTITISLSTLLGAGIMNNTFCLGIFLLLVYVKGLAWKFSAETICIVVAEILVASIAFMRVQKLYHAFIVFSIFPLCIILVFVLENFAGLD